MPANINQCQIKFLDTYSKFVFMLSLSCLLRMYLFNKRLLYLLYLFPKTTFALFLQFLHRTDSFILGFKLKLQSVAVELFIT